MTKVSKKVKFAAIEKKIVDNEISNIEKAVGNAEYIIWGDDNRYPQHLRDLTENVALLQTVINAVTDFACGSDITANREMVNEDDTIEDFVKYLIRDWVVYGGFAINVVRNRMGGIAALYPINFPNLRSDKEGEVFFYSNEWTKYTRSKVIKYPRYKVDGVEASSVLYVKNSRFTTYPKCPWNAAINAAEMSNEINKYQLNSIKNGFSSSVIVNLNNGTPSDEEKEEIENNIFEKFQGSENAGNVVLSFNDSKDNECSIAKVESDDFSERYKTAKERSEKEIYTAFRINPLLIGENTNNKGFARQEFSDAYALFDATVVRPIQKKVCGVLNALMTDLNVEITTFAPQFSDNEIEEENINE